MTVYLLAHGSVDPRHAEDVAGIAARLAHTLGVDVRASYLDLCPPLLADAAGEAGVVVPLLFSPGYHVRVDLGQAVAAAGVPLQVADPPLLTSAAAWGADLLSEVQADWPDRDVVLVTAGSRDAEVLAQWDETSRVLGVPVCHASGPGPRLADLDLDPARTVALPLLVARGHFCDRIRADAAAAGVPVAPVAGSSVALVGELARLARPVLAG